MTSGTTRLVRLTAALSALVSVLAVPTVLAQAPADSGTRVLSLGDAARLASQQSAIATSARARAQQAEARADQRRADLLPTIGANAERTGHTTNTATFGFAFPGLDPNGTIIGPVPIVDFRVQGQTSLFDLGAIQRWRAATTSAKASNLDAENAAEQAGAAAASAYLRALRAQASLDATAADSALASELLGIAQNQLKAGVGVALDVTRAQSQLAGVHAQLIGARNERDRTRLELLRTLGLPLDARIELRDSLAQLADSVVPDEAAAIDRALRTRPDLRAADAQLRAVQQSVRAIQAERLPTVGLFGDDGRIGPDPSHLLNTYDWGVRLSLPIFDGFRRENRIEEQQAVAREVDVRRRDLRAQAAIEVRSAVLDLSAAREQVDAARERLRLAEQEVSQARERFRAGVAGNADVVSALLTLNAARSGLIDAETLYQSARVGLARAEGTVRQLP